MSVEIHTADGRVVCRDCALADSVLTRLKGLLGRRGLGPGEGLLLRPANSVHTAFMRFPIDVVFLGRDLEVLDVRESVLPWRMAAQRGARAVLELGAGEAARRSITLADTLRVRDVQV